MSESEIPPVAQYTRFDPELCLSQRSNNILRQYIETVSVRCVQSDGHLVWHLWVIDFKTSQLGTRRNSVRQIFCFPIYKLMQITYF